MGVVRHLPAEKGGGGGALLGPTAEVMNQDVEKLTEANKAGNLHHAPNTHRDHSICHNHTSPLKIIY